MKTQILSFNWKAFESDKVVSLTVMTKAGEITILDSHSPLVTALKPCVMYIIYKDDNNMPKREDFAIGWGILEVSRSLIKVMADMLVDVAEVDHDKAEQARQKAISLMEKFKNSKDKIDMEKFIEAEDMLLKSIAQLKLHELKK